ncbi:immunoglobulin domain-containing protein [Streptomyces acidiscabies]|uniref:Immunoglobulin domain-containing protein n=1 Tax=Streptomyces acidiscabies TaxID=42234 RepID=A0AAP6EEL1_9ACTN|nr:immunoglobulin domain-containing protein [Streptomyces acidiscabies]MBP5939714.1 immunoglobulin domain-containing protein [Streptomyces sp. LBUM 1476]MBZ3910890.1 immunoglobulin domain-containing protein [Streptomyces acidiscabies]MDX2959330.1 immunoglobulin domain-containing protein [Streptomyces acidiscabies]MDX3017526.1 immunoglobulin domain-containing protein [Streptomyces acidiscabies]MDX3788002.1 immunoglobulin domain-containing protein [Streptomyces acidiscabies]
MTDDTPARRLRRPAALLGAVALVAATATATAVTVGPAAQAADTPRTAYGKDGQRLTVSASAGLALEGETLRVTGSGYDVSKGVYVALCKDNGDNRIPTPCLGGADQTGGSGASRWIVPADSTEAPAGAAEKWGAGGTFDVRLDVRAKDGGLDCTQTACSVVTRVDHNAPGDRSQDVRIPVTFQGQDPGGGEDGGVDVPAGTVSYAQAAEFTTAGRPLDVLVHPDSGKLYVGSDNIPDTADIAEQGLYALDPATGKLLSHIAQAPGAGGTLAARVVRQIVAPLPGDGVSFHFPLRGLATAKDGDARAEGTWLNGSTVTGTGPATASTVLVAQGATLSEVETLTGTVKRTISLEGGAQLGGDAVNGVVWSVGSADGKKVLRRVDTRSAAFAVTATAELPAGSVYFVEVDPANGSVWVAVDDAVLVLDKDGKLLKTLTAKDRPLAMAFDKVSGRAFVLREDYGTAAEGADGSGSLQILDSATFEQAAAPVALPGSIAGTVYAGVAVTPGATSVYLTKYAESKVVKVDLRVSPEVTQTPTDQTVFAGDEVTFVAAAEGVPAPGQKWEVSADDGQTWNVVAGATSRTYSFTARAAQDGYRYRVVFSNAGGTTRSSEFTLTVKEAGATTGGGETPGETMPSGTRTVTGAEGQKLTVTPVNDLAVEQQTVRVTGSGYDEAKGVYVALCVDNGAGQLPTPCIGGVDMTGASHSSAWISSNPPDYGEELATPYGDGGTFSVSLALDAKDAYTDCFKVTCVLATRADHTLSGDRSQDVKVPVSFVGQAPVETDPETGTTSTTGTTGSTGSTGDDSGTTGTTGITSSGGSLGGTTTTGGSLASTGVTVGAVAGIAALLALAGVYAMRRARTLH